MNSSRQIKLGALMSYVSIAFNIIAGLIYTPWMVNMIGKSDYGLFVLVTSFLSYFLIDFGIGQAIARFISKYRTEGDEARVSQLLGLTMKLYLLFDLIIFITLVVIFLFIENIFIELSSVELSRFKVAFIIAGFFSVFSFPFMSLNGILIAYERFVILKFSDLLKKVSLIFFMIIALFLGYKLYALVAVNAMVGILIIFFKLFYLSKIPSIKINARFYSKKLLKEIFSFSAWVTMIGIAQRLLLSITPAILGIFSGTTQIAIFAIGMTIEGYTWTFANALNGLFLPKVTKLATNNQNLDEVTNLMIKVGRIQLFLVGLLLIGFVTLGNQFIFFWMGEDFKESYFVAVLLIVPGVISLTQQIGNTLLFVEDKLKYKALLLLGASLISVFISILLSPEYGAIGSSVGIFTGLLLSNVIGINIIFSKVLKLNIFRFFRETHLQMMLPLVLSLIVGFLIQIYIPAYSLLFFFLKVILLGSVYLVLMWMMALNESEKKLIRSFSKKIKF